MISSETNTSTQEDNDIILNDIWSLYFHDPNDNNWTNQSYELLGTIGSIKDFSEHHHFLKIKIKQGMFFIMRDYIFPVWDDINNIDGGTLSIKILKDDMITFWEDICFKLLGETLLKKEYRDLSNCVNGISTSPKKFFSIIKIWVSDTKLLNKNLFDIQKAYQGDIICKLNRDNITNDNNKL